MTDITRKLERRVSAKADKRNEKRRQIMASASDALRQLGYAHTSLRDIAELSGVSLGQLHYYFEDRTDLILFCVHHYKDAFLDDLCTAVDNVRTRTAAVQAMSAVLAGTLARSADTHRLWYDIRGQAMFDPAFRPVVADIEASLIAVFADLEGRIEGMTRDAAGHYAAVDGLFRYLMQTPDPLPEDRMQAAFADLLTRLWA